MNNFSALLQTHGISLDPVVNTCINQIETIYKALDKTSLNNYNSEIAEVMKDIELTMLMKARQLFISALVDKIDQNINELTSLITDYCKKTNQELISVNKDTVAIKDSSGHVSETNTADAMIFVGMWYIDARQTNPVKYRNK